MDDANPGDFYKILYNFCIYQAKSDLTIPLAIVENSGPKIQGPVVQNPKDTVRIAIDCCYVYESGAQTDLVDRISRCVADYFEFGPGRLRHDFIQDHRLNLEQFKSFIQHIEIGKILARHRVNRPLSLFKDSITNHEAMQKIFESITCHAESMKPSLDQDGWRSVLRDLQRLQKLIPVVPIQKIFYMFCESLLSSGSAQNIELAGDVLKTMMEPEDQVALVVTAWTHYFSTSANLNDPHIDLAHQCLGLVRADCKEISECVDLISSLKSLTDFGLSDIHPVTVLNSKNRLEFVIKALDAKPHAYKNSQRLMKLATLLKAESIENLEGLVWTLVAKKALDVRDFNASHTACNNIIQCGYTQGWDVCFALGVQADFPDLQKCIDLLSFSVTHCDQDNIENVILSLLKVEQKLLHAAISSKVDISRDSVFTDIDEEEDEAEDKFEDTVEDLRARSPFPSIAISPFTSMVSSPYQSVTNVKNSLLNVTRLSTQYLVDNEVSRTVLTHTSSWIKELASHKSLDTTIDVEDGKNFECIRVPPFYGSLFSEIDVKEGLLDPAYRKFSMPRIESSLAAATQQALRSQLLSGVLLDVFSETEECLHIVGCSL